jgi:hypothetical protein
MLLVADDLDGVTDGRADECALERLVMVDGRAGHGTDDDTAGLAVVVLLTMMARVMVAGDGERAACRQEEREAQHRCLKSGGFLGHLHGLLPLSYCEKDAV